MHHQGPHGLFFLSPGGPRSSWSERPTSELIQAFHMKETTRCISALRATYNVYSHEQHHSALCCSLHLPTHTHVGGLSAHCARGSHCVSLHMASKTTTPSGEVVYFFFKFGPLIVFSQMG